MEQKIFTLMAIPVISILTATASPYFYRLALATDPDPGAIDPDRVRWHRPSLYLVATAAVLLLQLTTIPTPIGLALVCLLMLASWIDAHTTYLPDAITLTGIGAGIVLNLTRFAITSFSAAVLGAGIGYAIITVADFLIRWRRPDSPGIAPGDAKLLAGIGAWCGAIALYPTLMIAMLIMLVVRLLRPNLASAPFGPALAAGGFLSFLALPYLHALI